MAKSITETGPKALRGIRNPDLYPAKNDPLGSFLTAEEREQIQRDLYQSTLRNYQVSHGHIGYEYLDQANFTPVYRPDLDLGTSMFDDPVMLNATQGDIQDMRAENQPWYAKIGAGIGKAVVYAGTTFANGTAGLLYGLGKWAAGGNFSDVWNNEVTVAMDDIMKASELSMPNYRTQYEQEHPMALENIFSANFLGDSIIKNIGFLVGAYYSGGIFSKGAGLLLRAVGASRGVTSSTAQLVGGFMSAANEGGIESLNAANEFEEESMANLEQIHQARLQQIQEKYLQNRGKNFINTSSGDGNQLTDEAYLTMQQELAEAQKDYEAAQVKIQEDKARVGNVTFGLNLAILTPSNIAQFGRLYSRGFNTSRRMLNNTRRLADGTFEVTNKTKLGKAYTIAKGGVWEGTEEVLQQGASDVSQHHYYNDVFDYYKALLDDKENYQTQSWMQSVQESLYQTLGSESTWEQFLSGTIMGLMGMPGFRKAKDKNGNWQSPITLEGNAWSRYREMSEEQSRAENIVNYLNNRINSSSDFNAYYQGLLRRNKIDKDMIDAAENGDQFGYKNSEFAQLISDIEMFNSVGRSEDLISMINQALDTSDSNIESIIKNTTRITEDGKLDGPFAQYALANEDGTISVNFGSEQSKQEVKNLLTNKIEDVINTVNSYSSTRKEIDNVTNYALSDDQLNYLTYMSTQLDNWKQRAKEMAGDVKGGISGVVSTLEENLRLFEQLRDAEGQKGKGDLTEAYKKYDESVKRYKSLIDLLNPLRESSDGLLATNLTQNRKFTDSLIDVLQQIPSQTLDEVKKQELIAKLQDLSKVGKASELFNKKFEEFIKNPDKLNQEQEQVREQVQEEQAEQKSNDLKTLLNNANSLQEFRQILDQQEDQDTIDRTLKELRESGHEMAKKYQETSEYRNNVMKALDEANLDLQTKQDALKLLQDQFDNTEDLSQIANPNSIYINNDAAFDEDSDSVEQSQTRFQNARYALQNALIKVNKDNKFKDRFSNEYTAPKDQKQQGSKEPEESQQKPPVEAPVGDITFDSVQNENKQANQEEPQNPASKERQQYYRPAIPEVHIEASREGDFRDFNLVAKSELGQFHYLRAKKLNDEENALIDEYIKAHPNEPRNIQLIRNALKEKLDRGNQYLEGVLASPLPNFDTIYEYFVKNGTFEYLNQGLLHVGDEIAFMIDPEFEETIKNEPWHTGPVIFMINKKDGHVVGSLDSAASSLSGYEGLRTLEQKIIQEYTNRKPNQSKEKFIATPTTRVSKIMVGKIPYTNEERSLQNIPNINDGKGPIFGIIKNGVLTTNYALDDPLVIKPADMRNKEGRLYLLIPNGTGKYSPVAVRVKHFNKEEFNIENVDDASTKVGQAIKDAIEQLSKATSEEDVKDAVKILTKYIYLQDVHFNWFEAKAGSGIVIRRDLREADGSYKKTIINGEERIESWHGSIYYTTEKGSVIIGGLKFQSEVANKFGAQQEEQALKDPSQIYKEILDILAGFNLPMQVSAREINGGTYNQDRINSGILTSNLEKASTVGTWFTTDYFNDNGELQPAVNPASKLRHPVQDKTNPVGGTNNAINGTPIQLGNILYYVDSNTGNIYDKNGKTIEDSQYKELLFDLAWAQNLFGNAKNSAVMVDNKVITPNNKVLDRTTQTYLTGNEAQKVREAIEGKKQEQAAKVDKSEQQETQPVSPIMQQSEQTLPILDRRLDNQDSQEFKLHPLIKGENTQVYFELNGKLYKSTAVPFIKVNGIQLYIDRERNSYSEHGGQVSAENYYVIFPNGKVFTLARNQKVSEELSIQELRDKYASMFEKKPDKVIALSQEETLVTKALNSIKQDSAEQVRDQAPSKESETAQKLKEVDNKKVSRKRRPSKPSSDEKRLRRSTDSTHKIWDKEKELAWLNKVLPQLSEEDRIKLVSGLIHVAEQGIDAYGLFDGSVIVLSDIAAEGTAYHEAFHAVFKLLLDNNERASLLKEYSSKHPNMDDISLEEGLAEDFREFVMQGGKDTRSLGRKIIDFFKSLFIKTKYWKDFRPSSLYYFKKINDGKYAERVLGSKRVFNDELGNKIQGIIQKLYPEIELNFTDEIDPNDIQLGIEQYKKLHPEVETLARQMSLEQAKEILKNSNRKSLEFQLSKADRKQYEGRLSSIRDTRVDFETNQFITELTEEDIALFKYLDTIQEKKYQSAVFNWYYNGVINPIEDKYKIDRAIELAITHNLNLKNFSSPMEVVNNYWNKEDTGSRKGWFDLYDGNPQHLSNKREENGLIIYDVSDSELTAEFISENIISKFFDKSPWCIFQFNNSKTWVGGYYWNVYNAQSRKIAFDPNTGKPVGMFASADKPTWWDTNDRPHPNISINNSGDLFSKLGFERLPSGLYAKGSRVDGDYYIYEQNDSSKKGMILRSKQHRSGRKLRRTTFYVGTIEVTQFFDESGNTTKFSVNNTGKVKLTQVPIESINPNIVDTIDLIGNNYYSTSYSILSLQNEFTESASVPLRFLGSYMNYISSIEKVQQDKSIIRKITDDINLILSDFDSYMFYTPGKLSMSSSPFVKKIGRQILKGTLDEYLKNSKFKSLNQLKGLLKHLVLQEKFKFLKQRRALLLRQQRQISKNKKYLDVLYTMLMQNIETFGKLRNMMGVNYIPYEDEELPFQLDSTKILGVADLNALSVLIDRVHQKQDTLPHEYAHHYIGWFRNSKLVQQGISRFGSEEALVQAIGEQVVKQRGVAYNWWQRFTHFIINLFNKDQRLLNTLTDAFLNRADLTTLGEEQINSILANDRDKLNDMGVTRYMREEYTQEMQNILANAPRDSQGRLLAPNGEVSNLAKNEKQYAQVRTKNFKRWFGDWTKITFDENGKPIIPDDVSKVVDKNGEPLVVYHESPNIFNTFDISKKRFNVHNVNGIWASAINRKGKGYGENIYPLFINLRNPINTSIKQVKNVIELRDLENKALNDANSDGAILDTIDKFGYEIQYYVKSPNQVKSATDNIGTFDANNPDIRYRTVPNSSFEALKAEDRETLLKKGWTEKTFNSISQEERDNVLNCIAF